MTRKIAIYGGRGSFAEDAARQFFREEIEIACCASLDVLSKKIEKGTADYAVLPFQNSLAGEVKMTKSFLQQVCWKVVAKNKILIRQNLISSSTATIESLQTIESHPAALAQCRKIFAENPHWQKLETNNTALSAKSVIESRDPTRAAIANASTAGIYGGKILLPDIQDSPENYTKFYLLQKEKELPQ